MRNIILIFILSLLSNKLNSQTDFHKNTNDFKELKFPISNESLDSIERTKISRDFCWKYWISPISNLKKESNREDLFQIDSTCILQYKQWENIDLKSKELIQLYSPSFNGKLYCKGKVKLDYNLNGIFWGFEQNDALYGTGEHIWLAIYDSKGNLIDFHKIYENIKIDVMDVFYYVKNFRIFKTDS